MPKRCKPWFLPDEVTTDIDELCSEAEAAMSKANTRSELGEFRRKYLNTITGYLDIAKRQLQNEREYLNQIFWRKWKRAHLKKPNKQ